MGGINFWGSSVKHGESFLPLSFDDNILEVVAVFGCAQLGMSRFINLHRHRIAQVLLQYTNPYQNCQVLSEVPSIGRITQVLSELLRYCVT